MNWKAKKLNAQIFSDLELKYYLAFNSHLSWGRTEGKVINAFRKGQSLKGKGLLEEHKLKWE